MPTTYAHARHAHRTAARSAHDAHPPFCVRKDRAADPHLIPLAARARAMATTYAPARNAHWTAACAANEAHRLFCVRKDSAVDPALISVAGCVPANTMASTWKMLTHLPRSPASIGPR